MANASPVSAEHVLHGVFFVDCGSIAASDTVTFTAARGSKMTVQRYDGTGTVTVTGSMDGTTFGALHDASDGTSAVSITDAVPVEVAEIPRYIRVAAASNAASVGVTIT